MNRTLTVEVSGQININSIKKLKSYFLRRHIIGSSSHVNLLINIKTRNDEEHSRSSCSSFYQSSKSEDDCSLILLHSGGS